MDWLLLTGLAVASSIDNLAVAVSYGIRGIRIPVASNLLIAAICFGFSEAGVRLGDLTARFLPGALPNLAGAVLLFALGARILLLALSARARPEPRGGGPGDRGRLKPAVERLLSAQVERIGWPEAVLLGIALSANALTNAVGGGLIGLSAFAISSTAALGSFIAIALGVALGQRSAQVKLGSLDLGRHGILISGLILLTIAAARVI